MIQVRFKDEYFKAENQLLRIYLPLLFLVFFFNTRIYYLIRRKDSDAPSYTSITFILLLLRWDKNRKKMFLTTIRDTSVSLSPKIHCRGTIRFTLKRRDITRSQKEKQSTDYILLSPFLASPLSYPRLVKPDTSQWTKSFSPSIDYQFSSTKRHREKRFRKKNCF